MKTFYFTKTVTYELSVEADTFEEAQDIADNNDIYADAVSCSEIDSGWEENGYTDE